MDECGEKIRILIVEDSEDDALLIQRHIQKNGIEASFERVSSEDAFRDAIDTRSWDIVLCDYFMDGFTGLEALSIFQKYDLVIPFILISGTIGEETAVEAMRLGASDYIMKDNLNRLVPAIKREINEYMIMRKGKKNAEELREMQESFEAVFRASADGISIADFGDGTLLQVNDEYCRFFEYSREELIGKNTVELGIWNSSEERDIFLQFLSSKKMVRNYEANMGTSTGKSKDILISSEIVDIKGKPCILTFLRDITEKKAVEKALEKSESRFRNILENINQVIFTLDRSGIVRFVSPVWGKMTGYTQSQVLGRHFRGFIFSEDLETASLAFEEVTLKGSLDRVVVIRIVCSDGSLKLVRVTASMYRDPDAGDTEDYLGGIVQDVTELKEKEDELRDAYRKLHTLVEAMPDSVYLKDAEGKLVILNKAYEKLLGKSREELVGEKDTAFMPEDLASQCRESDLKVLETGEEIRVLESFTGNDNSAVYMDTHKVALLDERGNPEAIIGISRDVTAIKEAEKRYRHALDGAVVTISRIVEIRDPYTAGHQARASKISTAIAGKMGLDEDTIEATRIASLLYEVGKIEVPSEILNKPGKLNSMELELVRGHPVTGSEILSNIDFPWPIAEIVAQHHERMDGSGYPKGLKNGDIRIEARILGVADVLEAMCSHRPYRPSLGLENALEELETKRGTLYDPDVVDVTLCLYRGMGSLPK